MKTCHLSGVYALVLAIMPGNPSQAALLAYEGFTYTGPNLNGISPNTDTVGLRTDIPFAGTGAGTETGHYTITDGLTFGSLATKGNAVAFGNQPGNSVGTAQLSFSGVTGTLYGSYLVKFGSLGGVGANGFEVRIGSNDTTGSLRFRSFADSRNGTDNNPAVDYNASVITTAAVGTPMVAGTTYLVVSTFTRVGQALSAASPGVGSVYVFTNAQFEHMMAQADPTAYFNSLNALSVGTGANQLFSFVTESVESGTFSIPANYKMQFVNVGDVGTVDELRFATDFLSVVPVPEPATAMLAAVAAGMVGLRRRRAACLLT